MSKYKRTDMYDRLLEELLIVETELEHINRCGVAIGIVSAQVGKSKGGSKTYADCRKVPEFYHDTFCPYDFIITIYEPNCEEFSLEQYKILLFHELLHIGAEEVENGARMWLKPHDYGDFKVIIKRFGIDWCKTEEEVEEEDEEI